MKTQKGASYINYNKKEVIENGSKDQINQNR